MVKLTKSWPAKARQTCLVLVSPHSLQGGQINARQISSQKVLGFDWSKFTIHYLKQNKTIFFAKFDAIFGQGVPKTRNTKSSQDKERRNKEKMEEEGHKA